MGEKEKIKMTTYKCGCKLLTTGTPTCPIHGKREMNEIKERRLPSSSVAPIPEEESALKFAAIHKKITAQARRIDELEVMIYPLMEIAGATAAAAIKRKEPEEIAREFYNTCLVKFKKYPAIFAFSAWENTNEKPRETWLDTVKELLEKGII